MDKGYTTLVFPDYVSLYGLDHLTLSMQALKKLYAVWLLRICSAIIFKEGL
ncbi:MAG: hypothetical protein IPF93_00035 [Saprospiraceae bacterium]|nr:hypothetical protein [Saprospiraceae bacterium]